MNVRVLLWMFCGLSQLLKYGTFTLLLYFSVRLLMNLVIISVTFFYLHVG